MPLDTSQIGVKAAELMDNLAELYAEYPEQIKVGTVAIVVELDSDGADEEDPGWTAIEYRCTDPRRWIQAGLFAACVRAVERSSEG